MASASPLLQVERLNVAYGDVQVLWDVDLEIAAGEIVALVGSNGAGKSTLLSTISGLLAPRSGEIRFEGHSIFGADARRMVRLGIALVPEGRRVFANLTVEENLLLGAHTRGGTRTVADDVAHWLDAFPALHSLRRRPAGLLSGGEQQMLALARALMSRPKVMLLDEPSLGLAPLVVKSVFEFITRVREGGTAVVLVEQNARLALQRADRAIVMQRGEVSIEGTAADLADDPRVRDIYLGRTGADAG